MINMIDVKHKKIIQFILDNKITNYEELSKYIGISKRTIAKYLNEIRDLIQPLNVNLIIKQGEGVYFEGEIQKLDELIKSLKAYELDSKDNRQMKLYSKFILSSEYLKVQELADEFYVSKSTLESELRNVRKEFSNQGFKIKSNRHGMLLDINEKGRRELISKLINYYWGGLSYNSDKGEELILQIQTSSDLEKIFDIDILKRVTDSLNLFSNDTKLLFTDYEYQSLAIHLVIALDRIKKKLFLNDKDNTMQKVKLESNAIFLAQLVEKEFKLSLPDFEKELLNNHILAIQNSVLNNKIQQYSSIKTNIELKELITNKLIGINADDELIKSLILHLEAAIKRLQLGLSIYNPYTEKIKFSFPRAFETAVLLVSTIEKTYHIKMNDDEIAFIALHFESFFERIPSNKKVKRKAVIVCSSGFGTSKLLEQRMKSIFSEEIEVTKVLSLGDLENSIITEDLIISTIPVNQYEIPVVLVSPLLGKEDRKKIEYTITKTNYSKKSCDIFIENLEDNLIFIEIGKETKYSVLTKICTTLIDKHYAKKGVLESSLTREKVSSTAMGIFAMPHAQIEYINEPKIVIYINKDGIMWNGDVVKIIFFFALNQQVKENINDIYSYFNELISDDFIINKLIKTTSKNDVYQLLRQVRE